MIHLDLTETPILKKKTTTPILKKKTDSYNARTKGANNTQHLSGWRPSESAGNTVMGEQRIEAHPN
jgi:hypothetical protein